MSSLHRVFLFMRGRIEKLVGFIRGRSPNRNILKAKICKIDIVTYFMKKS